VIDAQAAIGVGLPGMALSGNFFTINLIAAYARITWLKANFMFIEALLSRKTTLTKEPAAAAWPTMPFSDVFHFLSSNQDKSAV
jgi:hypothetical protein